MSIQNRRAKFDYEIKETYVAGIVLESNEVKPLRSGKASIQSSFINEQKGEIYINNFEIISRGKNFDLKKKTRSVKKLLLNKREIKKILGMLTTKGFTAVPMEIFFNEKGLPLGVQFIGNYFEEKSLLQLAALAEKELSFNE